MGSACCVAARPQKSSLHNDLPLAASPETLLSLWDDNSQAEDVTGSANCTEIQRTFSLNGRGSRVASLSDTSHQHNLSGNISVNCSPSESSHAPHWPNSPLLLAHNGNSITASSDLILSSHISETSSIEGCSASGPSLNSFIPESLAPSLNTRDYLSRRSKSQPSRPGWFKSQPLSRRPSIGSRSFFSRHLHHACNNDLSRELSLTQNHELDSSNSSSKPASDGRHSSMLAESSCNSTRASRGVSDWWSMQTFSDLVASSRRDGFRWSDAEGPPDMGWVTGRESMDRDSMAVERIKVNNSQTISPASHLQVQICGICSHNLPYNSENLASRNNLSVVAVLFCGHVYHAECLEQITPEASQHDPSCPICIESEDIVSERLAHPAERVIKSKGGFLKSFRSKSQSSSRNKMSRRVANDDIVGPEFFSGEILLSGNDHLSSDNVFKLSSNAIEKHPLNKRLFTRHFSLKGKSRKEHGSNDTACKLPITLRDSGESSRASDLSLLHAKKGSSSSFRYFKKWVQD